MTLKNTFTCTKLWYDVSHIDTTMCGSLNIQELHQGYLSGVRLLRVFSDFIGNGECAWCVRGLFSFLKCVIGE